MKSTMSMAMTGDQWLEVWRAGCELAYRRFGGKLRVGQMTEIERIVEALKRVETGRDRPDYERYWMTGDDGQALGPWQLHPAFFIRYWTPKLGVTWQSAFEDAVVNFVSAWLARGATPNAIVQIFNLGADAYHRDGKRNPEYAAKFKIEYDLLAPAEA